MIRLPEEQAKQNVFRVSAKKVRNKDLDFLLECEEFGLLDVGTYIDLTKNDSMKSVWVMRSIPDIVQTSRPSRTPFVVVGVGDREPDSQVHEVCMTVIFLCAALKKN
ncbi:unnamed protein product [Strongylus vulgaris]|uniref:p-granule-associated protein DEPS-1 sixth OB-fold domain-containing protein n=1 Tax=Strongylus vulgaris TaxID=40348 RepID=A0A3P7IKH7_STRVU|nr:unnamed protein product [Strongylus vulgaris]